MFAFLVFFAIMSCQISGPPFSGGICVCVSTDEEQYMHFQTTDVCMFYRIMGSMPSPSLSVYALQLRDFICAVPIRSVWDIRAIPVYPVFSMRDLYASEEARYTGEDTVSIGLSHPFVCVFFINIVGMTNVSTV